MSAANGSPPAGLPPSAGLRREPEVPVRPDFSERWGRRLGRLRDRHPALDRALRRAHALWSWVALILLVIALAGVPALRAAPVVGFGLLVALVQLVAVSRSRTVSFASCARFLVVGALLAVPIGLVEAAAATSVGIRVDDPFAVIYLAGPIEELLKLSPLLLLVICARHRVRRFAVVDFCLVAAATGAGFQLAEDAVRRVAAPPRAAVAPLEVPASLQYAWTHLLPGWVDSGPVRFSGHLVLTGLVGLGIGLAVRLRRRYGRIVWLVPLFCFHLAVLDHMAWADAVTGVFAGEVLGWPVRLLHALFGSGHAARWLLLALLAVAVVLDYRATVLVEDLIPSLPGKAPGDRLVTAADGLAGTIRRTVPDYAAPVFHRLAGGLAAALVASAQTLVRVAHEGAVFLVAARRGPMVFFSALRVVRERRELAQAVHRAAGRPRRDVPPRAEVRRRADRLTRTLLPDAAAPVTTGAAVAFAMAVVTATATAVVAVAAAHAVGPQVAPHGTPQVGPQVGSGADPGPAFVATLHDELANWWYGLLPPSQLAALLGALGLLAVLGGIWALPTGALGAGGAAGFLRDPGRTTREFLGNLTPGQVLYYGAARALGLAVPETARRLLEGDRPPAGAPARRSSRLSFPPWHLQKRYGRCAPLFDLPPRYTPQHGELLREALEGFVDAADTAHVPNARYGGRAATIYYDPRTRLAVIVRPGGEFWSAWRLSPAQYHDVVSLGTL